MAKYKHTDIEYGQGLFLTVNLKEQLLPGTFEYMLNSLIGSKIDISEFDQNYKNDDTGANAIAPCVLIKLIIYGYLKGAYSSRKIYELGKRNIIAKSLSEGLEPHWTTIADFISSNSEIFQEVFVKVLLYCTELDLIGGEEFALDGCRLPSNASIELSGTEEELKEKLSACRKMAEKHVAKHWKHDELRGLDKEEKRCYQDRQKRLNNRIEKISIFLDNMEIKNGKWRKEVKSNVTDNESAMIRSSAGFLQGYIGLAVSDKRNQIILSAEAVGNTNEGEYFPLMLDKTLSNIKKIGIKIPEETKQVILADAAYFSEDNLRASHERNIEAIIPDSQQKRRFNADGEKLYEAADFNYHEEGNYYECLNGKKLEYKGNHVLPGGSEVKIYKAKVKDCRECSFSKKCLKSKKEISKIKSGKNLVITKSNETGSLCRAMLEKLNTEEYQERYAYRMQIVEPVFANIKYCKGLNRFTLRGKKKVTGQWLLYCIVHNLGKCLKGYNLNMGYT
jgi:transposase